MKLKQAFFLTVLTVFPLGAWAAEGDPITTETMLLDVPTAQVLDRYQASFLTRAYSHGSLMETIEFGVFPRINLGVSFSAHELVGNSSSVKVLSPDFQAKWKLFDGDLYLPAIAIGYDGRRYGYGYKDHLYTYPIETAAISPLSTSYHRFFTRPMMPNTTSAMPPATAMMTPGSNTENGMADISRPMTAV